MRPTIVYRSLAVLFLFALLGSAYFWGIRPSQLHWGATPAECERSMSEDQIVNQPVFDATRAITIHATPQQIYPWLAQMGYGRAGFYGYDLVENLGSASGIRSATAIVPAFQNPRPGDVMPLSIAASLVYGPITPNRSIIWRSADDPCDGVFIWELVPISSNTTRLISRIRWNYQKSPSGLFLGIFTEFADHIAVRKILEGVRDRAEGRPPESLAHEAIEIGSWCIAGVDFIISLLYLAFWRKWAWAWALAFASGILLEWVLYDDAPLFIRAAFPSILLVVILAAWVRFGRFQNAVEFIPR